ncbi:suppressor of fused domain protein [Actinomadura kijaniata]|uniref:suppressor of fused domain protein n=1 Tax=Actinomadura kijaniata TaxID=46161 RepID=UPI003F1B32A1
MMNYEGWDAIDALLRQRYPDVERLEWHAPVPYRPVGPAPVGPFVTNSMALYRRAEPVPHWHMIGYALTAPFEERGYEFTLRVPRAAAETEAPDWALAALEGLAAYVSRSGNDFAAGHYIEYPHPIDPDRPGSRVRAGAFVPDPELGEVETERGRVTFLQFVGLTSDELQAAQSWHVRGLIGALEPHLPVLVTDMDRASLADHPEVAGTLREGSRREGSGTGHLFFHHLEADATGDGLRLEFGAQHVPQLARVLPARIPHGRRLTLTGDTSRDVVFVPGPAFSYREAGGTLEITLPGAASEALAAALDPAPGDYTVPGLPGLRVTVTP